jgi:hypothetical protein
MTGEAWTVNSDQKLAAFCQHVADLYSKHKYVTFKWTTGQQRTAEQNSALHLWCERVAITLNDAGLEMVVSLPTGKQWTIPWSKHTVKENIWRPVQEALTGKISTTEPKRIEYSEIHEVIHSRFANHHGITLPAWPTRELTG